jgi:hypothetical protein
MSHETDRPQKNCWTRTENEMSMPSISQYDSELIFDAFLLAVPSITIRVVWYSVCRLHPFFSSPLGLLAVPALRVVGSV